MGAKLFIQKKEIHIGDTKKEEAVSQIPYSTISFEDIFFQASNTGKAIIDDLFEEDDTKHENGDSSEEESNETSSDQNFEKVLLMNLKVPQIQR